MELLAVIMILAMVAGLVLVKVDGIQEKAKFETTKTTLDAVRDAIVGTPAGHGYKQDMNALPATLRSLYAPPTTQPGSSYNPFTHLGWNGPYLRGDSGVYQVNPTTGFTTDYSIAGDPAPVDAWNHPIIVQVPASDPSYARLVSAGPDGVIETPLNYLDSNQKPYPPQSLRGDDIVLFLLRPDVPSSP